MENWEGEKKKTEKGLDSCDECKDNLVGKTGN